MMDTARIRENTSADPSCSADDGVTELQNAVLGLLEEAGVPQDVCDLMIMALWRYENCDLPEQLHGDLNASFVRRLHYEAEAVRIGADKLLDRELRTRERENAHRGLIQSSRWLDDAAYRIAAEIAQQPSGTSTENGDG
jgi:hypothetical protein